MNFTTTKADDLQLLTNFGSQSGMELLTIIMFNNSALNIYTLRIQKYFSILIQK